MRLVVLLLCLGLGIASAQEGPFEVIDTIKLVDGSILKGTIVGEDDATVVLETILGRLEIARADIEVIERQDADGKRTYEGHPDPDTNTVFFTPTPETIGDGAYFRNFLLFFLNWGLSVHDDFDLSIGTLFPVSDEFYWVSAGAKWRLLSRDEHPVGLAVLANGNLIDGERSGTIGGVIGIGNDEQSLNVSVGRVATESSDGATLLLIGADTRVGERTKMLVEYGSTSTVFDDEYTGLLNIGFRWYGERMSFSLTGFRPLEETGGLVFFPFTMFSMRI